MSKEKEGLVSKAQAQVRKGKKVEAIKLYEEAFDLDARDIRIMIQLAKLYAEKNDTEKSIKYYSMAADYLSKDGFYSRAVACYKEILSIQPKNIKILKSMADLYSKLGLNNEAEAYREQLMFLGESVDSPIVKMAAKVKRQPRRYLKGGLAFRHQPRKTKSKKHRQALKTVKKS